MDLQFKWRPFKMRIICFSLHWFLFVIALLSVASYVKSPHFIHYAQLELNLIFFHQDVFFPVGYLSCIQSLINVVNSSPILKKYLIKNHES